MQTRKNQGLFGKELSPFLQRMGHLEAIQD